MKKQLPKIVLVLIFFPPLFVVSSAPAAPVFAPETTQPTEVLLVEPEPEPTGKELYLPIVQKYASEYGVSAIDMTRVIDCESSWVPNIQSQHLYTTGQISRHPDWGNVGDSEKSHGLSQLHLPAGHMWKGKLITKEMANTPEIAIEFMAYSFSIGKKSMWSCL